MKIILTTDVNNVGSIGDELEVKSGFARNHLIPKGFAKRITRSAQKEIEHYRKFFINKRNAAIEKAKTIAEAISGKEFLFKIKVGEKEKTFGSITSKQIISTLAEENIQLDKKCLPTNLHIKTLGEHNLPLKLHSEILTNLVIKVISE